MEILRTIVTSVFGFLLLTLITANVRELLKRRGWDAFLASWSDALSDKWSWPHKLSWPYLSSLWWLWSIFGFSGGVALALWLSPILASAVPSTHDAAGQIDTSRSKSAITPSGPLDAALEATKHLPSVDRERLADALYDFSKLFDRANKLSDNASRVVFQIGTSIDSVPISDVIDTSRRKLNEVSDSAKQYSVDFDNVKDKWKYYAKQVSFIVGDNPDARIGALRNAIGDYIAYFEAWSKIKNISELRGMILFPQYQFSVSMGEFAHWAKECDQRLQQIKSSL